MFQISSKAENQLRRNRAHMTHRTSMDDAKPRWIWKCVKTMTQLTAMNLKTLGRHALTVLVNSGFATFSLAFVDSKSLIEFQFHSQSLSAIDCDFSPVIVVKFFILCPVYRRPSMSITSRSALILKLSSPSNCIPRWRYSRIMLTCTSFPSESRR